MPLMYRHLYAALREANVPDELARAAAEEAADNEHRFQRLERDLDVLKWMVGTNVAISLAVLARLLIAR